MIEILNDPEKYKNWTNSISNGVKLHWKKYGHNWTNKKHKPETIQKIKDKAKLRVGSLNSSYGRCWIYNEQHKISKKIGLNELEKWLNIGWKKGRKMFDTISEEARKKMSQKGSFWITNGNESKRIYKNEPIPKGWFKGRSKK